MASRRGRISFVAVLLLLLVERLERHEAIAAATAPLSPVAPLDPGARSAVLEQGPLIHVLDTSGIPGGPYYVNDHTLVQAPDGAWHLFGIFHHEPIGSDTERAFLHAVAGEPDPSKWTARAFDPAPAPFMIALEADATLGETHIWAPHIVSAEGRYCMVYQGGGKDGDRASIRLAESDDLYRWVRLADVPLFEDICEARDPMLTRRDGVWALHYTRCESPTHRVSGVAVRLSSDLAHWTEPRMVLTLRDTPEMPNSGFTESPFAFERGEYHYLSVTSYPLAWDATMLYRSRAPFAFVNAPFTRLRGHAAEWIFSGERVFMTHAGPGQSGVWVAKIDGL